MPRIRDSQLVPGLASFATAMLQEGTTTRSSQQIANEFEFMGSQLSAVNGRERTVLAAETLSRHFSKALELVADVVQNPTFPEDTQFRASAAAHLHRCTRAMAQL